MAVTKGGVQDIPGRHVHYAFHPGAAAATATSSEIIFEAMNRCRIKRVAFIASATITGQITDYFALDIVNRGTDGTGSGTIATAITFSSAPIVATAGDALEFTLSTTDATITLAAGSVLAVLRTKTGNGLLMSSGLFVVEYEPA